MRILDVQAEVRGALQLGAVHALLVAEAQLLAAVAELLAHLVLGALEGAAGGGMSSVASLLLEGEDVVLARLLVVAALGGRWLLLVVVQGDVAQLQLAAHVLGILHVHALVRPRVVLLRTAGPAVHHAALGAVTDLVAADLQALPELVDTAHVVAVGARLGRGCNVWHGR